MLGTLVVSVLAIPTLETGARAEPPRGSSSTITAAVVPLALIENRRVLSYPLDQVWPTAIRYLRIDRGFEITDRDQDAGYILFQFPLEGQRIGSGSLEMFATDDAAGRASVSMSVNTGAGPVHLPNSILDGISAKVRAERGQPLPPPPRQEEPPPDQDDPEDDHSVPLLPPAQQP
ncbi:hypothetical protein [Enhygromyxa salina]|uniref:Uncharacterized protein n=1 Tax=Enhygromyxa salina TaxID=215803 RepID=A0A2S9Y1R1_9BACT|nr:hypothetical protein [Enhygromyxa salina]PRP99048.1 hypothetical protein ENSA7_64330 [Enhygromyxa salina]